MKMKPIPLDLFDEVVTEFFWAHISRGGDDDCWEWEHGESMYGAFFIKGHNLRAHRVAWSLENGCQVPEGKLIRHLCHNKRCCNPKHLAPGTQGENMCDTQRAREITDQRRARVGLPPLYSRGPTIR